MSARPLFISLRPKQWFKNVFVLAALFFSLEFLDPVSVVRAGVAFVIFCMVASSLYLVNDISDREEDRAHEKKKKRPIASGALSIPRALLTAHVLGIMSLALSFLLSELFAALVVLYAVLMIAYSTWLKRVPIFDCLTIAAGFVIRVVAGAVAISVPMSSWFVLSAFFLSFFLAATKREQEMRVSPNSRHVLKAYTPQFLTEMTHVALVLTLCLYTLYTFSSTHSSLLVATVPVVLYGLLRFRFQSLQARAHDGPADDVLADPWLLGAVFLWGVMFVGILWFV